MKTIFNLFFLFSFLISSIGFSQHDNDNRSEKSQSKTTKVKGCNISAFTILLKEISLFSFFSLKYFGETVAKPITYPIDIIKLPKLIRDKHKGIKSAEYVSAKFKKEGVIYSLNFFMIFAGIHPVYYLSFDPDIDATVDDDNFNGYLLENNPANRAGVSVYVAGYDYISAEDLQALYEAELKWHKHKNFKENVSEKDLEDFFDEDILEIREDAKNNYSLWRDTKLFEKFNHRVEKIKAKHKDKKILIADFNEIVLLEIRNKLQKKKEKGIELSSEVINEISSSINVNELLKKELEKIAKNNGKISHLELDTHGEIECLELLDEKLLFDDKTTPLNDVFTEEASIHLRSCLIGKNFNYMKKMGELLCDKGCQVSGATLGLFSSTSTNKEKRIIEKIEHLQNIDKYGENYDDSTFFDLIPDKVLFHLADRHQNKTNMDVFTIHANWFKKVKTKLEGKKKGKYTTVIVPPRE